jgi:transcriptional regulator GlxA family with amidase domain
MNSKLKQIQNWAELAQSANWSAAVLAKKCQVSVRTLERYFLRQMNKSPKAWLAEQRQHQAVVLLREGLSIKEVAALLSYRQASNFTRKYKSYWGICPTVSMLSEKPIQSIYQSIYVAK